MELETLKTLKNLGVGKSEIGEYIDDLIEKHDTYLTSFAVNVPVYPDPLTLRLPQESLQDRPYAVWNKYTYVDIKRNGVLKRIYTDLKANFTYEVTGYNDKEGFSEIWFLRSCTLKPKMIFSKDYYATGIATFYEYEGVPHLSFTWIHPYLRGQKILSNLVRHLYISKGFISVEPPITKPIENILDNLVSEALKQPKIFSKFLYQALEQGRKKFPFLQDYEKDKNQKEIFILYSQARFIEEILKIKIDNVKDRKEILEKICGIMDSTSEEDKEELKKLQHLFGNLDMREITNFNVCRQKTP